MIKAPKSQVRLTNVAMVRYKVDGHKFEVAWYKNKIQNWRDNVETDINEVLQVYEIFTNVSKGEIAKTKDVTKLLHKDKNEAIKIILEKGQMQVSDLERESEFESMKLKIANIVSAMWVNKETSVPFPVPMILKAMDDINFCVKENQNEKKQALMLIKELPKILPIERAKMKIKFTCNSPEKAEEVKKMMEEKSAKDKEESKGEENEGVTAVLDNEYNVNDGHTELIYLIMPKLIRDLTDYCNKDKEVSVEIVEHHVYARLVSQQEEEEAKILYEKALKERQEVDGKVIVVSKKEEGKGAKQSHASDQDGEVKWTTCNNVTFSSKAEFKAHYKSEWHIENTKRKMNGGQRLSEEEYQKWKEDEIDKELFFKENKGKKNKKGKRNK